MITQPALVDVHVCLIILIVSLVRQEKKRISAGYLTVYLFVFGEGLELT